MDWAVIFNAVNLAAMAAWIALIALPRWPALLSGILYLAVGGLCALYAVLLVSVLTGILPTGGGGGADFTSIAGVRAIFGSDAGVVIGWTHYLAFDLFVGLWIARDADAKYFARWFQAPVLIVTFIAGPLGLIIWLLVREPRARARGRFQ